jgi:SAM-dependent methyltransferase
MAFDQDLVTRTAADYADFLLPHLSSEAVVLDGGCGSGAITVGLGEHVSSVVGIDLEDNFDEAISYAARNGQRNVSFQVGDICSLDFPDQHFDACLSHSALETVARPIDALTEIKRVLKQGAVIGVASVDYGGIILAGEDDHLLRRFYEIREKLWQLDNLANPYLGRELRGLLDKAGFEGVVATTKYVSYGTPVAVEAFGIARAKDCDDDWYVNLATAHGLATVDELGDMKRAWQQWSQSPIAFFAFPWCRAIGWKG